MKTMMRAMAFVCAVGAMAPVIAEEPMAEKIQLKDGSTLYLHPDGTGRMVDQHGKPMSMADGTAMETTDGKMVMMMNKHIWVRYGPPGKGGAVQKFD
jgi:hypothetical protein